MSILVAIVISDCDSYGYIDGCKISVYTRRPQLPHESDGDSNSKSLYIMFINSFEHPHLVGIWFVPKYPQVGVETDGWHTSNCDRNFEYNMTWKLLYFVS